MGSVSVVMQMLYVCVLCASCGSSQCYVLHDLQFVNAVGDAIGDHTEEAYSIAGLITALYVAMRVSFCLPHSVAVSAFMICRGLCACTEMLWMCVLYVSFGSKVRPRYFGCVAMGSALLFIVRSRFLVYSAGSGVNRVQVVCLDLRRGCFILSRQKLYVGMVVCISWLHSYLCVRM